MSNLLSEKDAIKELTICPRCSEKRTYVEYKKDYEKEHGNATYDINNARSSYGGIMITNVKRVHDISSVISGGNVSKMEAKCFSCGRVWESSEYRSSY